MIALDQDRGIIGHPSQVVEIRTGDQIEDLVSLGKMMHSENSPHLDYDPDVVRNNCIAVRNDYDRKSYNGWIAYKGGEPVGFLVGRCGPYFFSNQCCAEQVLWYVVPSCRSTRVAFRLIQMFEEWARMRGAAEIITGVMVDDKYRIRKISSILTRLGYPRQGFYHRRITIGH